MSLVYNEQGISKYGLLICLGAAFALLITVTKNTLHRIPILVVDVAIVGMVVAFAVSGNWAWFWSAGIVMAAVWIVARKMAPRKLQTATFQEVQLESTDDLFTKYYGPERDIGNPYKIGHH